MATSRSLLMTRRVVSLNSDLCRPPSSTAQAPDSQ